MHANHSKQAHARANNTPLSLSQRNEAIVDLMWEVSNLIELHVAVTELYENPHSKYALNLLFETIDSKLAHLLDTLADMKE